MKAADHTFALDIGTRSVVGLLLSERSGVFEVIDAVMEEHNERSMLDGQIHDIQAVAKVIVSVKEKLEKKYGPLTKVSVAAAGRALKTLRAEASIDITGKPILEDEAVSQLELMAVQLAQQEIAQKETGMAGYDCVGYSVISYKLDQQEIGSLLDQQGHTASAEIIATFLPKVVTESLLAALKRADLEMLAMTLEPIAAINVLIPASMRRLNVALVDIGAGTSDIAITSEGTVTAYGMVPAAGDAITEAVSDEYLLDFHEAERVKRELNKSQIIHFKDILGYEKSVSKEAAAVSIQPAASRLAKLIKEEILSLNSGKPPKAVMLIGGGSLTPGLPALLAEQLSLPEDRIAIRGIEAIQQLHLSDSLGKGPELVTPIGIAITSSINPIHYVSVSVNGQKVRLLQMKKRTVSDSLLSSGIQLSGYYGKPGLAYFVSINGRSVTVPGTYGEAPVICKNGRRCSVDEELQNGDQITIQKGKDGHSLPVVISDLIDVVPEKKIILNGEQVAVQAKLLKNGTPADPNDPVADRDVITYTFPDKVMDLFQDASRCTPFCLSIDGRLVHLDAFSGKITINHEKAHPDSSFKERDQITAVRKKRPTLGQVLSALEMDAYESITIFYNQEPTVIKKMLLHVYRGGVLLSLSDEIRSGDDLKIQKQQAGNFIFQDVFKAVDVTFPAQTNKRFLLLKNEQETSFHEELSPGDRISIKWM
ncbi:pilus assembly protein PilM [Metabacillus indicus]|uniref:pilus assembly protein PilM n=1 Tax=Metabacillus indicus TaxID=246786 RepID=UPI0024912344|nr:cell division FtsA domain-containing protein [Metabacillus indicus]